MRYDALKALGLFRRALLGGATRLTLFSAEWECHDRCTAPRRIEVQAITHGDESYWLYQWRKDAEFDEVFGPEQGVKHWRNYKFTSGLARFPWHVLLTVPCRRCDVCRKRRSKLWAARAFAEVNATPGRVWRLTLTASPQEHFKSAMRCRVRFERHGEVWDALPYQTQFADRASDLGRDVTKMLKRWRKAGYQFRYLLVVEPHEGDRSPDGVQGLNFGMPHFHMLVHEYGVPMPKRFLEAEWPLGHCGAKLLKEGESDHGVWYVCHYLNKTIAARVRASLKYGSPPVSVLTVASGVIAESEGGCGNGSLTSP